jgi:hypothetical protein
MNRHATGPKFDAFIASPARRRSTGVPVGPSVWTGPRERLAASSVGSTHRCVRCWCPMVYADGVRLDGVCGPGKRKREHAPALVAAAVALLELLQSSTRRHLTNPKSR